jgi:phosphoserine phosphatase RsbU/P
MAARSRDELFGLLSSTLQTMFANLCRCELFLTEQSGLSQTWRSDDENGFTVATVSDLARLRSVSADMQFVPSLHGVKRGLWMSAPLLDGRVPLGLLVVEAVPGRPFESVDLEVLEGVANLFALAFQRLHATVPGHRWAAIELDRRSAGQVQRNFMNGALPASANVTVDARYLPALDVGGDFYDLAYLGDGQVGGAIGDVAGKGVAAALIMSRVSSDLRRALRSGAEPSRVLETVNASLADPDAEAFVTATCIRIDTRAMTLTVANAGHLPLLVRREDGEVLDFGQASGAPLGMVACNYADETLELRPRDIVVLMTDGLVESLDIPDDPMASQFLRRVVYVAPHDPEAINTRILAAMHSAKGDRPPDDMTLVALQIGAR